MKQKTIIIGAGFSSLSAACYLAKSGREVVVYEKNDQLGGRAGQLKKAGFTFDTGPSWYWMPDVFERFFGDFGKNPSDYYQLEKLNPAYTVFFGENDSITIGDTFEKIKQAFEKEEAGSGKKLEKFIQKAQENYAIAMQDLVYKPGTSLWELATTETIGKMGRFFGSIASDVRKEFKNEKLIRILEFPVLFLGAKPSKTPSFYSFMNYADFGLGTWYPKGGMFQVVKAMEKLAVSLGVEIHTGQAVEKILTQGKSVSGIVVGGKKIEPNLLLSGADYQHTETLLEMEHRQYSEKYWESRTFAPSALLFFVGFDKKLKNVSHHNLFFDVDFDAHTNAIYDEKKWPEEPMFYANFTSITDRETAPENCENGFFLIPIAPGMETKKDTTEKYFKKIITRFEELTQQSVEKNIIFKESFSTENFIETYNAFKGNAYGMATTLEQTAYFRPKMKSKKVENLYFTGQLTVPGPGVPPALISGKVAASLIEQQNPISQKLEPKSNL